ncbi:CPSF A subunit region-domain-containing protein [Zychaea mexicana]|uniref:CPSF A subunit region-domain-containing protein n=1 Tax=Zychaea mexicana TaxID=64656 RepID=UPI0022FDCA4A|nr:CPSF A subunit region-domain-containing protein [Zychaea mexicana]KAI9489620.1 CPSF A subunit region-domain-containing protein [Zychaea mexicana]
MSAYTIYKELFPPQTVEHVKYGQFTTPDATNLIVAKASLLQIYDFVEYTPTDTSTDFEIQDEQGEIELDENAQDRFNEKDEQALAFPKLKPLKNDLLESSSGRLELVAQYKLNGNVASMGIVRTASPRGKQGCDSLLLAFNDAKMSLLEWSPSTNSIVTVSIHYYEREEYKKEFLTNPYPPDIHIDPQQRCAVLNFFGDKLAVLPFRQPDNLESSSNEKFPYSASFVIDLESIDRRIKNVIDMAFLGDYYEPTLAILFQTNQTWTGRLANTKDTVSVVVISLDLSNKIYPIIYSLDHLPYDCRRLVAMPKPVNGLLVLSGNSILHVSQGSPGVGVALNGYTKTVTEFPGMIYNDETIQLELEMDGAIAMPLSHGRCLLFLQNGDWVAIKIRQDGSKVIGMDVSKIPWTETDMQTIIAKRNNTPLACVPTCVANIKDDEYFFLGSRVGDSQLIKWRYTSDSEAEEYTFRVCDTLLNSGPIADMAIGQTDESEEQHQSNDFSTLPDLELASCSGHGKNGALCVLQRHIRPITTFQFNQNDCEAVWSVKCRKEQYYEGVKVGGNLHQEMGATAWDATADFGTGNVWSTDGSLGDTYDKLLFIGKKNNTLVLAAGEELRELQNTDFYTAGRTVLVNTLFDNTRIVQVHRSGVLLLSPGGKLIQTINVKNSKIVDASIRDPYILLRLSNKNIMILRGDTNTKQLSSMPIPASISEKKIALASVFADTTGLFARITDKQAELAKTQQLRKPSSERKRKMEQAESLQSNKKQYSGPTSTTTTTTNDLDFDEIDLDLYGEQDTMMDKQQEQKKDSPKQSDVVEEGDDNNNDDDDDDALLYGSQSDTQNNQNTTIVDTGLGDIDEINVSVKGTLSEMTRITFWCLVYAMDGTLQLFSLPEFEECFTAPLFNMLSLLVTDRRTSNESEPNASSSSTTTTNGTASETKTDPVAATIAEEEHVDAGLIQEILMTNIGKERKDPHLVVRTRANNIVIYKAFSYVPIPGDTNDLEISDRHNESVEGKRLAIRLSRVHHEYVSRETELVVDNQQDQAMLSANGDDDDDDDAGVDGNESGSNQNGGRLQQQRRRLLIPFDDVAGYTGVFVAGSQPIWLMCSCKSFVRVHPMSIQNNEDIIGFTQFHNVNCHHGFLTIDSNSNLRLCNLPTDGITYDMDWVMRKVPLGQTVHKIEYHPTMHVYAALVSEPKPTRLRNDEGAFVDGKEDEEREPGQFLPVMDQYSLIMISPVTWETVDRVDFQEYEQGLSLHCSVLESKQTSSGKKHFMAVGTGYLRGEDTAMRGSIYVFDIIEVVPEPNNPQTNHRYKHLHTEDVKGAVTAMCDVSGHLVSCIGSKVIIWSFEDNESLVGVAFIDVQIFVTSICSIKNFIVLGDAQKSVWFLGFQLEPAKLVLLGKDYQSFEVSTANFIIDDKSMYLLIGDTDDNFDIFQYAPFNLQSFAGQKLMRRGDFHVGTQVRSMVRLPQISRTSDKYEYDRRHFCLCGTFGGSISVVSPIPEKTFKRLNTLYGQLVNGLQHVAGLNPRAFRLIKGHKQRMSSNRTKAVLDGDLIFEFAGLSVNQQREMTKQIGTTVARIMEDLVDIDSSIDHF